MNSRLKPKAPKKMGGKEHRAYQMENIGQKRNHNHVLDESSNQIVFSEKKISHKKTMASVREGHSRIRSKLRKARQCREVAEVGGAGGRDVRTDKEWQHWVAVGRSI